MRCGVYYICSQGVHAHRDTQYDMRLIDDDESIVTNHRATHSIFFNPCRLQKKQLRT